MLQNFITNHRDAIIAKARHKLTARPWPTASATEVDNGVPIFLTQLSETLRQETTGVPYSPTAIGSSATRRGRDLLAVGFTVSQVVHDYGDICQAVTEVALEENAAITTGEFHTLNRCLDTAIAEAVTEHARITAESRSTEEVERAGHVAHETRDLLNTALLAFEALKRGAVGVNGNTAAVLGRSLMSLRDLTNSSLSDIRLASSHQKRERLPVASFLSDIADVGRLHAEYRGILFGIEPVDPSLVVSADAQIFASAITNLLNNAFKFTHTGGRVTLRAQGSDGHAVIEVEDECGGIPDSTGDPFRSFGDQRGTDRTGLGLGLSIARKAARAHGGDIRVRNMPGRGCVFSIEVPLAKKGSAEALPSPEGRRSEENCGP